jgi:hypothetical protein
MLYGGRRVCEGEVWTVLVMVSGGDKAHCLLSEECVVRAFGLLLLLLMKVMLLWLLLLMSCVLFRCEVRECGEWEFVVV